MSDLKLFIDGSVNPKSNIGYGACLLLSQNDLPLDKLKSWDNLKSMVKVRKFENTSSTKLELQYYWFTCKT